MNIIAVGVVRDERNAIYRNWAVEDLRARNIPVSAWGPNARTWALAAIARVANGYRRRLTSAETHGADVTPERVVVWQRKAALATGDRAAIPAPLRGLLDREATAKGRTLDQLLDVIAAKAGALDQASLLIDALQAEAEAAVAALPVDDTLPETLAALLGTLDADAEAAFASLQS